MVLEINDCMCLQSNQISEIIMYDKSISISMSNGHTYNFYYSSRPSGIYTNLYSAMHDFQCPDCAEVIHVNMGSYSATPI